MVSATRLPFGFYQFRSIFMFIIKPRVLSTIYTLYQITLINKTGFIIGH